MGSARGNFALGDFTLRPARAEDAAAIVEVTQLSVEGLARGHYSGAQIEGWTRGRDASYYRAAIALGRMHVAELDGRLVGFVDSVPGEVTRLFILPEIARRGLGRRLMELGLVEARKGHAGKLRIEATRNAVAFYERFGFAVTGHGIFSRGAGNPDIEIVQMAER
ncbi:MAG: GNAT family N-acetyltransferase [Alphaproteobacteria bacterium]